LIIGNTIEFGNNESIVSCFESYRRNTQNPEIVTFDELYHRAEFIVNNKLKSKEENEQSIDGNDDLPF
jgi:hypothetical protein